MVRKLFRRALWQMSLTLTCVLAAAPARAQQKLLTLDDIYGVTTRVNFSGTPVPAFAWIDGERYVWPRPAGDRNVVDWMLVNAATGAAVPLFDADKAEVSLASLPGVS